MSVSSLSPTVLAIDYDDEAEGLSFLTSRRAKLKLKRAHYRALCYALSVAVALTVLLTVATSVPAATTDHIKQFIDDHLSTDSAFRGTSGPLIPRHIWQIYNRPPKDRPDADFFRDTLTWHAANPDHTYTLLGSIDLDAFVARHFSTRPDIVNTFKTLATPILLADFERSLLLDT